MDRKEKQQQQMGFANTKRQSRCESIISKFIEPHSLSPYVNAD